MLVNDFLRDSARRLPDKVALVCDRQRFTYAQIDEQANRVANALITMGVRRGDRLAIWLPNSLETVTAIFGVLKAGGTFTVINPTTKLDKLAYILNNCSATGILCRPKLPGRQLRSWTMSSPCGLPFYAALTARILLPVARMLCFLRTSFRPIPQSVRLAPALTSTWLASSTPQAAPVNPKV